MAQFTAGQKLQAAALNQLTMTSDPLTTGTNGTATSGTTETFDVVLGYYATSLVNGDWYRAILDGLIVNGSVAADVFSVQIRDSGSASNPTSSSTLIALSQAYIPAAGSGGRESLYVSAPFQSTSTGTHTFGVSATRLLGTGVYTPIGTRYLYVVGIGGV